MRSCSRCARTYRTGDDDSPFWGGAVQKKAKIEIRMIGMDRNDHEEKGGEILCGIAKRKQDPTPAAAAESSSLEPLPELQVFCQAPQWMRACHGKRGCLREPEKTGVDGDEISFRPALRSHRRLCIRRVTPQLSSDTRDTPGQRLHLGSSPRRNRGQLERIEDEDEEKQQQRGTQRMDRRCEHCNCVRAQCGTSTIGDGDCLCCQNSDAPRRRRRPRLSP